MIKKILMVDDSRVALMILKSCLPTDQAYVKLTASDGAQGLEKYKTEHPDITFLDLTMPVMDGIEALEKIRQYDKHALIVVCSADSQKKVAEKVASLGALMMIKKPASKETVRAALLMAEQHLQKSRPNKPTGS